MKNLILILILIPIYSLAQCWQSISTGYDYSMALSTDGALWSWGNNDSGQLGYSNGDTYVYTPRLVNSQMAGAKIFTVGNKSFVIKSNGTLWACGDGVWGGLGTGTQNDKYVLTQIGTDSDWSYITAGAGVIGVKTNGTLWGWGANIYGMLNLGSDNIQMTPIQISAETNWSKVIVGSHHTLAIKTDGTLWACGLNNHGQLGDGTITNRFNFVQIGTDTNWSDLGTEFYENSLAIKADGTIWGWGNFTNNQLGSGFPSEVHVPTQIGSTTNWAKVSKRNLYILGIKTDGTLWESSLSGFYQIGTDTDWVSVYSGTAHSFAMKADGSLWAKGDNSHGQLGFDFTVQSTWVLTLLSCSALNSNDITNNSNVLIYPNPTSDILFIQNNSNATIQKISVSDLTGKTLLETTANFSEINIQTFQSGIYILNIYSDNKNIKYKIIKK